GGSLTNISTAANSTNDSPVSLTADSMIGSLTAGSDLILNGVISGNYGFSKGGPGGVVLTAANTYTGATVVAVGALRLTGSASIANSRKIIVGGGATFNVSGLSSALTLTSAQT